MFSARMAVEGGKEGERGRVRNIRNTASGDWDYEITKVCEGVDDEGHDESGGGGGGHEQRRGLKTEAYGGLKINYILYLL